ncbi:MAG: fasciclin domain-containing protein [Halioglobus sp.]|nr:fasciclin domain-containing protein [Halioglobus sp.]
MNVVNKCIAATALALAMVSAAFAAHHETPAAEETIVSVAAANGEFSTLVAALQAAGLDEVLQGEGPFTVFAPTNAAFAALPPGTVESLLKPENKEQLAAILTYHVVPGSVYAADVIELDTATTVQGGELRIDAASGGVKVDGANVIAADIEAGNGVIHVIDAVLMP